MMNRVHVRALLLESVKKYSSGIDDLSLQSKAKNIYILHSIHCSR